MVLRQVAANFTLEQQRLKINEIGVDLDAINITLASYNVANWNTAYGWGNHANAGYLTSYTETDPIFTASVAFGITSTQVSNWDTAYGWGDHSIEGYLTTETSHTDVVVDGDFTSTGLMKRGAASGSYSIITDNSTNWDTAYGWGDHSTEGYLTVADFGATPPVNANDPGTAGEIRYDSSYIYVCVAASTWKRSPLSTWP